MLVCSSQNNRVPQPCSETVLDQHGHRTMSLKLIARPGLENLLQSQEHLRGQTGLSPTKHLCKWDSTHTRVMQSIIAENAATMLAAGRIQTTTASSC